MKTINIKESLIRLDRDTDFRHSLTDLYEACRLDEKKKEELVQYIEDRDIDGMSKMLSNESGVMTENVSDDLSLEEAKALLGCDDECNEVLHDMDSVRGSLKPDGHMLSRNTWFHPHRLRQLGDNEFMLSHAVNNGSVIVKYDILGGDDSYLNVDVNGKKLTTTSVGEAKDFILRELDDANRRQFDVEVESLQESWYDVYNQFNTAISDIDSQDSEAIQDTVDKLYRPHEGEADWDEAWRRWNEPLDEFDENLLMEGPFSVLGDLVGKGVGDAWKGVKNFARGVRDTAKDVAKTVTSVAKSAVRDTKQSKTGAKVRDAVRAVKGAGNWDEFKADYQRRQDARKPFDKVRNRTFDGKLGKTIGDVQDWKFQVNGKKLSYDQWMKLPKEERTKLIKSNSVKAFDISGRETSLVPKGSKLSGLKEHLMRETYAHFDFKSGANPYIAFDDVEAARMLRKYKGKVTNTEGKFYTIDDTDENEGKFSVKDTLTENTSHEYIDYVNVTIDDDTDFGNICNGTSKEMESKYGWYQGQVIFEDEEVDAMKAFKATPGCTVKCGVYTRENGADEDLGLYPIKVVESLTEGTRLNHPDEKDIESALLNVSGTTKVEFDWCGDDGIYRNPENHLIMLVFTDNEFGDGTEYFDNRYKWKRSVLAELRKMGWTLEDPVEDNDSYLYLVMQKRAISEATAVLDRPKVSNVHTHRGSFSGIIDAHMDEINDMINSNVPASHIVHSLKNWVADAGLTKANAKYAQNTLMRMANMRTAEEVGMYLYNIRLKAEDDAYGSIDSQFYSKKHKYEDLNEELLRESADEEDKPFTHSQIFDELKRETANFSIGNDRGIYSFEKEVKMAEKILKKHYETVKVTERGNDFMVEFSGPKNKKKKVNESVDSNFKYGDVVYVKPSKKLGRVVSVKGDYITVEVNGGNDPDRRDTFYPSDLELQDSVNESKSLRESAGRFELEVWVPGSGGDDRERFIMASNNLQDIIDKAYEIDLDGDEAFYLRDMKDIYPYDLDQCYDAEELEDAIYNEWHYEPSADLRKQLGKVLLPQNEDLDSDGDSWLLIKNRDWYDPEGLGIKSPQRIICQGTRQECEAEFNKIVNEAKKDVEREKNRVFGKSTIIEEISDTHIKIYYPMAVARAIYQLIQDTRVNKSIDEAYVENPREFANAEHPKRIYHWTQAYGEFENIVGKFFARLEEIGYDEVIKLINKEVESLYRQHDGEPAWDQAWIRWLEPGEPENYSSEDDMNRAVSRWEFEKKRVGGYGAKQEAIEMTADEMKAKHGTDNPDIINAGKPEEERVALKEGTFSNEGSYGFNTLKGLLLSEAPSPIKEVVEDTKEQLVCIDEKGNKWTVKDLASPGKAESTRGFIKVEHSMNGKSNRELFLYDDASFDMVRTFNDLVYDFYQDAMSSEEFNARYGGMNESLTEAMTYTDTNGFLGEPGETYTMSQFRRMWQDKDNDPVMSGYDSFEEWVGETISQMDAHGDDVAPSGRGMASCKIWKDTNGIMGNPGEEYTLNDLADYWTNNNGSDPVLAEYKGDWKAWLDATIPQMEERIDDSLYCESKSTNEDLSSITALADDCGKNTFKKSARDVRFTFEDEKSASEFMNKLKEKNIHYDELSMGVIKVSKSSVLDESKSIMDADNIDEAFDKPDTKGPFWYLCKHGIGPGALPKGVNIIDTVDDEENSSRVYVALDKVLTTDELKRFEMKEQKPPMK